jgi:hypothetical protein
MNEPKPSPKRPLSIHGPTVPERQWIKIMADWRRCGVQGSQFCRRRRLAYSAFRFWKKELPDRERRRRERRGAPEKASFRIIPVRVVEKSPPVVPLEVLSGGRTLRIPGDFDPTLLRKVLSVLEGPR